MNSKNLGLTILVFSISVVIISTLLSNGASAQVIPEWIKNVAKWYGTGMIPEEDFINAIKFLIENDILVLESEEAVEAFSDSNEKLMVEHVIIPNGNSAQSNVGFYDPLNLKIKVGMTVAWVNEDNFGHTVQSQDGKGNVIPLFNSNVLQTGDTFEHKFDSPGEYHYFCTLHPWRVGLITAS